MLTYIFRLCDSYPVFLSELRMPSFEPKSCLGLTHMTWEASKEALRFCDLCCIRGLGSLEEDGGKGGAPGPRGHYCRPGEAPGPTKGTLGNIQKIIGSKICLT